MKKTLFAAAVVCLLLSAGDALAQCHSVSGPWQLGGRQWYDYVIPRSCWTTSNVTNASGSCFGGDAWSFGAASSVEYTFTTSTSLAQWLAGTRITFNDTTNSNGNWIQLRVTVNGGTPTIIFTWDGTMGDLNGCAISSGTFPASNGDSVKVQILADAGSGTPYIEALVPAVTNYNF
jgi:hypothetical protein